MILATIAVAGFLSGVAGLSIGLMARNRVDKAIEECADVLRRQLQVATGAVDNKTLRDIAIVHYDALREMSGERSFSLALLNSVGDGVVLSSINGRTETRTYAKVVMNGHGVEVLSPEEDQAVRAARLGKGPVVRMDDPLPDFGHRSAVATYSLDRPLDRSTERSSDHDSGRSGDGEREPAAAAAANSVADGVGDGGADDGTGGGAENDRAADDHGSEQDVKGGKEQDVTGGESSKEQDGTGGKGAKEQDVKNGAATGEKGKGRGKTADTPVKGAAAGGTRGRPPRAKPEAKLETKPEAKVSGNGGGGGAASTGSRNARPSRTGGQRQGAAATRDGGVSDKNGRRSETAQSDGKAADVESGPGGASARR